MKRRTPMKKWSVGVQEEQGLFEFIKECLAKKEQITINTPRLL